MFGMQSVDLGKSESLCIFYIDTVRLEHLEKLEHRSWGGFHSCHQRSVQSFTYHVPFLYNTTVASLTDLRRRCSNSVETRFFVSRWSGLRGCKSALIISIRSYSCKAWMVCLPTRLRNHYWTRTPETTWKALRKPYQDIICVYIG